MAEVIERAAPAVEAEQPRRVRFEALAIPTFRWYWITSWISSMGDGMENVLRNWLVLQLAGKDAAFWLGMMVFAHWIPFTIFSLYGGVLADRYDNRKVQTVAQLCLMAAATGVAIATLAGFVTVWWIFGLLLLHGFAGAIGGPARQTLIHAMVGPSKLLSAVSINSSAMQISQVIGPAIAGVILITFGPGWGFLVNALTFIPLLVFLTIVRVPNLGERSREKLGTAMRDGVRFVRGRPIIGSLIAIEMMGAIFLGHTFNSLLPLFVTQTLGPAWTKDQQAIAYSFLLVGSGVGALGTAVYLAYARAHRRGGLVIIGAAVVEMVAILIFAFSTDYWLSFALMIAVGATAVLTQSLTNTTIQLSAPDNIRGRVMGAYTFGTQGMRVLNGPILGGAAVFFGAPAAVAGAAAVVIAAYLAIAARVTALRAES